MSPKNYVKIAVNHEVCSKMGKLLISNQVVSLLASQGTCVTGYGSQRTGTFDSCIYTKLQQIMVTQSEKFKRKTSTDFFLRWRDLAVQYPGFRTSPTFASVWILLKPKSPFNTLRLQMRPNEAKHFVCTRATDGTRTTSATNLASSPTCILDHQSR